MLTLQGRASRLSAAYFTIPSPGSFSERALRNHLMLSVDSTEEEAEARRGKNHLPKVTQLVSSRTETTIQSPGSGASVLSTTL